MEYLYGTFEGTDEAVRIVARFDFDLPNTETTNRVSGDIFLDAAPIDTRLPDLDRYEFGFISTPSTMSIDGNELEADVDFVASGPFNVGRGKLTCRRIAMGGTVCSGTRPKYKVEFRLTGDLTHPMTPQTISFQTTLHQTGCFLRDLHWDVDVAGDPGEELSEFHELVQVVFRRHGVRLRMINDGQNLIQNEHARWSESDLLAFMDDNFHNFASHRDQAAWRIYFLAAPRFRLTGEPGETVGFMFDGPGPHQPPLARQRQGAAVFYEAIKGQRARPFKDLYVHTCVHELGHALNLLHPFDPNVPGNGTTHTKSFMNYPHKFPGGADSYWDDYAWTFDPHEQTHFCHNLLEYVIPGGLPYASHEAFSRRRAMSGNRSSQYELSLRVKPDNRSPAFQLGEPVHLESKLRVATLHEVAIPATQAPVFSETVYCIYGPQRKVQVFRPLFIREAIGREKSLSSSEDAIYSHVDLTFGADGFTFETPGPYAIQAITRVQGELVVSKPLTIRVTTPLPDQSNQIFNAWGDPRFGPMLTTWGVPDAMDKMLGLVDGLHGASGKESHPLYCEVMRCTLRKPMDGFITGFDRGDLAKLEYIAPQTPNEVAKRIPEAREWLDEILCLTQKARSFSKRRAPSKLSNKLYSDLAVHYSALLMADGSSSEATQVMKAIESQHDASNKSKLPPKVYEKLIEERDLLAKAIS